MQEPPQSAAAAFEPPNAAEAVDAVGSPTASSGSKGVGANEEENEKEQPRGSGDCNGLSGAAAPELAPVLEDEELAETPATAAAEPPKAEAEAGRSGNGNGGGGEGGGPSAAPADAPVPAAAEPFAEARRPMRPLPNGLTVHDHLHKTSTKAAAQRLMLPAGRRMLPASRQMPPASRPADAQVPRRGQPSFGAALPPRRARPEIVAGGGNGARALQARRGRVEDLPELRQSLKRVEEKAKERTEAQAKAKEEDAREKAEQARLDAVAKARAMAQAQAVQAQTQAEAAASAHRVKALQNALRRARASQAARADSSSEERERLLGAKNQQIKDLTEIVAAERKAAAAREEELEAASAEALAEERVRAAAELAKLRLEAETKLEAARREADAKLAKLRLEAEMKLEAARREADAKLAKVSAARCEAAARAAAEIALLKAELLHAETEAAAHLRAAQLPEAGKLPSGLDADEPAGVDAANPEVEDAGVRMPVSLVRKLEHDFGWPVTASAAALNSPTTFCVATDEPVGSGAFGKVYSSFTCSKGDAAALAHAATQARAHLSKADRITSRIMGQSAAGELSKAHFALKCFEDTGRGDFQHELAVHKSTCGPRWARTPSLPSPPCLGLTAPRPDRS